MHIEPIHEFKRLTELEAEWRDLYERAPEATPFQRPEWLLPWWRTFGSGELFSFAAYDGDKLIALAPMFLHPWNNRRQVTFIGNGISDRLGFILDPAHAMPAAAAILDAIARERHRWDVCDFQDLSPASVLCRSAASGDLGYALRPQYTCTAVPLRFTWEEFHASLPHGLRRNLRRYREHLDQQGRVTFETTHDVDIMSEPFNALVELHRARWLEKSNGSMLEGASIENFHRAAVSGLAKRGIVRLHSMRLDGRIIAIVYAWIERGRAYSYLGGFDPALSRFSPGALSLEYAIEQSIGEGARVFDFLRGDESYKTTWGAIRETTCRLLLWHEKVPVDLLEAA
jgi:CelD/BcsL family acetyltransferase involved in cellulose biosynthesis